MRPYTPVAICVGLEALVGVALCVRQKSYLLELLSLRTCPKKSVGNQRCGFQVWLYPAAYKCLLYLSLMIDCAVRYSRSVSTNQETTIITVDALPEVFLFSIRSSVSC